MFLIIFSFFFLVPIDIGFADSKQGCPKLDDYRNHLCITEARTECRETANTNACWLLGDLLLTKARETKDWDAFAESLVINNTLCRQGKEGACNMLSIIASMIESNETPIDGKENESIKIIKGLREKACFYSARTCASLGLFLLRIEHLADARQAFIRGCDADQPDACKFAADIQDRLGEPSEAAILRKKFEALAKKRCIEGDNYDCRLIADEIAKSRK
jgi:hypothetical protein